METEVKVENCQELRFVRNTKFPGRALVFGVAGTAPPCTHCGEGPVSAPPWAFLALCHGAGLVLDLGGRGCGQGHKASLLELHQRPKGSHV